MNRQCYVSLQSLVNQKIFQIYRYHDVTQAISGKSGSAKPCYCFYHLCTELKCFMLYMFYHTLGSELDLLPFISSLCINMVSTTFWALFFFFGFMVVQPHDFFMELLAASVPGVDWPQHPCQPTVLSLSVSAFLVTVQRALSLLLCLSSYHGYPILSNSLCTKYFTNVLLVLHILSFLFINTYDV